MGGGGEMRKAGPPNHLIDNVDFRPVRCQYISLSLCPESAQVLSTSTSTEAWVVSLTNARSPTLTDSRALSLSPGGGVGNCERPPSHTSSRPWRFIVYCLWFMIYGL